MMKVSRGVFRDADIGLVHAVIAVVHRIAAVAYRGPVRRVVVGFDIGLFHEIQVPAQEQVGISGFVDEHKSFRFEGTLQCSINAVSLKVGRFSRIVSRHLAAHGVKANCLRLTEIVVRGEVHHGLGWFGGASGQRQGSECGGESNQPHNFLHKLV